MASAAPFMLSTECMPQHHGGVHALVALSDDILVSGSDDHTVCVWRRVGRDFACVCICTEAEGQLRALTYIGAQEGFPTGGFAAASLDKRIRCYAFDPAHNTATLVHTLSGHEGGVISLGHTDGTLPVGRALISGSWDGTARVWDLTTGALLHTLEGHENGTCVLGLPGGVIAVGSTGRKVGDAHVDFKLRMWRLDVSPGAPAGYALQRTLEEHDQAIRGLAAPSDSSCFVSVGNDGAVKVRDVNGTVRVTFLAPLSQLESKPYSVFGVGVTRDGRIAACVEDQSLRVYDLESGRHEDVTLPGVPWAVDSLTNGDIVVACNQAGTSARGHVYVWTKDAARAADDMQRATLEKDLEPPKRAEPSSASGEEEIKVSGPYEHRAGVAGTSDGQYGFFRRADGSVMVCAWSAAAAAWTDIGVMEDAPGGSAAGAAEGGMELAVDGASGTKFDYMRGVTMETASGMRSLQLAWNEGDDPNGVAHAFIDKHGLGIDSFEQVRDFILEEKKKAGKSKRAGVDSKRYEHFPTASFVDLVTVDWAKLLAKLRELNAVVIAHADPAVAAGGMTKPDDDAIAALVDVLAATSRYHSSTVPRAALQVLHRKLMLWPAAQLLPVWDLLRMLVVHLDAAEGVVEVMAGAFVTRVLARISETRSKPESRAVTLLSARILFNAMKQLPTRRLVMARLSDVLDATADLLNYEHDTVKSAAAVLCHNLAHAFLTAYRSASDGTPVALAPADVEQFVAVVTQNLVNVKQPEAALSLVQALGTACLLDPQFARTAASLDANASLDAVVAACPTSKALKDATVELRGIIGGAGSASARSS